MQDIYIYYLKTDLFVFIFQMSFVITFSANPVGKLCVDALISVNLIQKCVLSLILVHPVTSIYQSVMKGNKIPQCSINWISYHFNLHWHVDA